jgi:hypothetical protein
MSRGRGTPINANSTLASGTPSKNLPKKPLGMTLKEKLHALDQLQSSKNSNEADRSKNLLALLLAPDLPEPTQNLLLPQPERTFMKRINFDAEISSASSTNNELGDNANELEYLKKISTALEHTESGKKLCRDLHEAELASQFNREVRLGDLMEMMENQVIPALEKLFKDPIRIHDLIRQAPTENSIACKIEDQEQFVESFKRLSENCGQLRTFFLNQSARFDLQAQISSLESIAENLDNTLSMVVAEKIKFRKLQSLLAEVDAEVQE